MNMIEDSMVNKIPKIEESQCCGADRENSIRRLERVARQLESKEKAAICLKALFNSLPRELNDYAEQGLHILLSAYENNQNRKSLI